MRDYTRVRTSFNVIQLQQSHVRKSIHAREIKTAEYATPKTGILKVNKLQTVFPG